MNPCKLLVLGSALMLAGCGMLKGKNVPLTEAEAITHQSADIILSALNGISDDQAGSTFARNDSGYSLIPSAYAAACSGRTVSQACSGANVRESTFADCTLGASANSLAGTARLSYVEAAASATACDLAVGDEVTRLMNLTYAPTATNTILVTSDSHGDFRGQNYSGGTRLRRMASSYEFRVLGISRISKTSGVVMSDVSLQTTSSAFVAGSLARGSRILTGGVFEISHTTKSSLMDAVPDSLTWGSTACCLPTSGKLTMYSKALDGTRTGTATLTFTGCGTADLSQNGKSRSVQFTSCE